MIKVYTKTGDSGTTSLLGGKRLSKNDTRVEAYGTVDELNSLLGIILAKNPQADVNKKLTRVQKELFVLGSDLSTPLDVKITIPRITKSYITRLEKEIDRMEKSLPRLKNFILPGGSPIGAKLHLARSIARRAERSIVKLTEEEKINKQSLRSSTSSAGLKNAQVYINRLSDWLFVLARYVNKLESQEEKIWKGRKSG
ncbi:MAG TPA: cob(I)yrinic acid a,c-diamide adenosyltransferase [Patescibacteria group bacterium]|nr:cob(I)yrinic acid a,c-diamide adenosyltransferase [Patescibacteria group bacterium]